MGGSYRLLGQGGDDVLDGGAERDPLKGGSGAANITVPLDRLTAADQLTAGGFPWL